MYGLRASCRFLREIRLRNRIISGAATIALGLLIALSPQFLFKVCNLTEHGFLRCHWSAQAEIGVGILIAMLWIFLIIFANLQTQLGLTVGIFFASIFAWSIPHVLIGGCNMMSMACRRAAFPALSVMSVLALAGAVGNMVHLESKTKEAAKGREERG